jgi:hypothetical protein
MWGSILLAGFILCWGCSLVTNLGQIHDPNTIPVGTDIENAGILGIKVNLEFHYQITSNPSHFPNGFEFDSNLTQYNFKHLSNYVESGNNYVIEILEWYNIGTQKYLTATLNETYTSFYFLIPVGYDLAGVYPFNAVSWDCSSNATHITAEYTDPFFSSLHTTYIFNSTAGYLEKLIKRNGTDDYLRVSLLDITGYPPRYIAPPVITVSNFTYSTKSFFINWTAVAGAEKYLLYYRWKAREEMYSFSLIRNQTSTSYTYVVSLDEIRTMNPNTALLQLKTAYFYFIVKTVGNGTISSPSNTGVGTISVANQFTWLLSDQLGGIPGYDPLIIFLILGVFCTIFTWRLISKKNKKIEVGIE